MSAILEFADKLRAQIDIVDVVGRYVDLRRGGVNLKGLCPFHREKSPSFTVSQTKQIFHCFGCNEGGDAIKFIQKVERLEWIEAVRLLASQISMAMPEFRRGDGQNTERQDQKDKLTAACVYAAEYFSSRLQREMLAGNTESAKYLERRQLPADIVSRFQLGVAADAWQDLLEDGTKHGFERDTLITAGLVIHNQTSQRFYDRFRKRIIFPVHDALGRPIAFGARVYASDASPDEPKYVNSPETPLYHKGQALYALHIAKDTIARESRALLMEGYMDVIRAHQHGFMSAVATCGTALTEEQARTLRRYCSHVIFVYDGDEAGRKAMLRGCEVLLDQAFNVSIVCLPDDHDPDSYLLQHGSEAFSEQLQKASNFFEFFLEQAAAINPRDSPDGKVRIVEAMLPLLKRIGKSIAQNEYIRRVADFLSIDPSLIVRQLSDSNPHNLQNLRKAVEEQDAASDSRLEKLLLKLAVESPVARTKVLARIQPEWLRNSSIRRCFHLLLTADEEVTWDFMLKHATGDNEASFLRGVALNDEPFDAGDRTIDNVTARIQVNHLHLHNKVLMQQLQEFYASDGENAQFQPLVSNLDESGLRIKDRGSSYFLKQPGRS